MDSILWLFKLLVVLHVSLPSWAEMTASVPPSWVRLSKAGILNGDKKKTGCLNVWDQPHSLETNNLKQFSNILK